MRAGMRTAVRPAPVAIWQLPTSSRAAVMTHRSVPERPASTLTVCCIGL
jgi:hypothetical protein